MTHRNHHEREFEAFLAGEESELARLYRRLPQAEPDAKLDAAVLALARTAVEPQRVNALRHAKARHRRPWWLVGLSSAAGLVLAAGVAWQMRNGFQQGPATALRPAPAGEARDVVSITPIVREEVLREEAAAAPPEPAAPAAFPAEPSAVGFNQAAPKPAPPPDKNLADKKKAEAGAQLAKGRASATAAAPAAAEALAQAAAQAPARQEREQPRAEADALETVAQDGAADDRQAAGFDRLPGAADKDQSVQSGFVNTVPDYNSVERKAALATGSRRDEYGLSGGAPADAEKSRPRAKSDLAARAAPPAAVHEAPAAPARAEAAPAAAAPATAPAGSHAGLEQRLALNSRLPPADWVEAIRRLLREGQRDEAVQNLKLLREKHPHHALPQELRELER